MKKNIKIYLFLIISLVVTCFFDNKVYAVSSGSCCVYRTSDNIPVYFYTLTHDKLGVLQPAICLGDNCITDDFSKGNAQFLNIQNQPTWRVHAEKIFDCSNMPENIWYNTIDGVTTFYARYPSSIVATEATISVDETCTSDLTFTTGDSGIDWDDEVSVNCDGIIGKDMLDFLNKIFGWIQIIAPIVVIILGGVDLAGAVLQDDKDALKKATSKFIKRLIVAVALFFIPIILEFILTIFNKAIGADSSTCNVGR